jgi:hypothetical protein
MTDETFVTGDTTAAFKMHRASIGVIGFREGTIQSVRIPVGAILTAAATIDYARVRVPMMWDGRRIEVFATDLELCATQIQASCSGEAAGAEQPIAGKPPMRETNSSKEAKRA